MKANAQLTGHRSQVSAGYRLRPATCILQGLCHQMETRSLLPVHGAPLLESRTPEDATPASQCARGENCFMAVPSFTAVHGPTSVCQQHELHTKGCNITPVVALGSPCAGHPYCGFSQHFHSTFPRLPGKGESVLGESKEHQFFPSSCRGGLQPCSAALLRISGSQRRPGGSGARSGSSTLPAAKAAECLINPLRSGCDG